MKTFLLCIGVYCLIFRLLRWAHKKPEPPKARPMCCHCLQFHDGRGNWCEACEFAIAPDGIVQEEVREQVDSIQYRTSDLE